MLRQATAKADSVQLFDNVLYPMLRLVTSTAWPSNEKRPTWKTFFDLKIDGQSLGEAIKAVSLIRTFYEKDSGVAESTNHVLRACSPELARVLSSFQWFDQHKRYFCDIPLPNLITDLLVGLYGFPYHANVQKIERFAYKGKETVMFTDILVFDQARYMYDLLPTLPLFDTDFTLPQQLVLRACMDALHRHCHYGCKDLFWGSALAGLGEEGFTFWLPGARECIGELGIEFAEPDADGYEVAEDDGAGLDTPF